MNKKLAIIIGIILLIVLGGTGLYFLNQNKTKTSEQQEQNTSEKTENKSLKELLGVSTNQQCTFTDSENGTEGVVYVSSGKLRGDFTSKIKDVTTNSHVIANGESILFWTDGEKQGFKISQNSIENLGTEASKMVDIDKEVAYSCMPWAGTSSVFNAPAEITFKDFSELIPSSLPTTNSNAQCAACSSLTGEAKSQCELALKCN